MRAAMGTVQAVVVQDRLCGQERVLMGPMSTTPIVHKCTCSYEDVADTTILVIQCDHCLFLSNSLEELQTVASPHKLTFGHPESGNTSFYEWENISVVF